MATSTTKKAAVKKVAKKAVKKAATKTATKKAGPEKKKKEIKIKYSDKSAGQPELVPIFEQIKAMLCPM